MLWTMQLSTFPPPPQKKRKEIANSKWEFVLPVCLLSMCNCIVESRLQAHQTRYYVPLPSPPPLPATIFWVYRHLVQGCYVRYESKSRFKCTYMRPINTSFNLCCPFHFSVLSFSFLCVVFFIYVCCLFINLCCLFSFICVVFLHLCLLSSSCHVYCM